LLLSKKPKLSIGFPVYNGEEFIQSRLENILSQTFQDFEIIISDNCSVDKTSKICQEFALKDNRIQYYKQKNNMGGIQNYQFVLDKAKNPFFVFATHDDLWEKTFLEKNILILENNFLIVGSISKIIWTGKNIPVLFDIKIQDNVFQKYYKKFRKKFQHSGVNPISEKTFEGRSVNFIRQLQTQNPSFALYCVYRTDELKKSIKPKKYDEEFYFSFWNNVCINVIEYGSINVIDEVLLYYNADGGGSGVTPITQFQRKQISLIQCIIPWSTQISWLIHKFGFKYFLKHFLDFFNLFIMGEVTFFLSLFKEFKE
jgi:glycosyltransferase involved in cell wall biosynthesis